uniref:Uncharacterized protein n=1 Tax=Ditylenchus dipsaci TaxID=166011 RepID=A0A915DDG5_9BILA
MDPKKRPSATEALNNEWLVNVDPDRVPPPSLPTNQDCHEMWSKKMKAQRNQQRHQQSTDTNGGIASTSQQKQRRN